MSGRRRTNRKVDEVRRMLDVPGPKVPADLASRAAEHGARLLRRHRVARRVAMCLMYAAVVAFAVWAWVTRPWETSPAGPPLPPPDVW